MTTSLLLKSPLCEMRRLKKGWDLYLWLLLPSPPTGELMARVADRSEVSSARYICPTCVQRSTVASHYCTLVIPSLQIYPGEEEFSPGGFGIFHRTPENPGPRRGILYKPTVNSPSPSPPHQWKAVVLHFFSSTPRSMLLPATVILSVLSLLSCTSALAVNARENCYWDCPTKGSSSERTDTTNGGILCIYSGRWVCDYNKVRADPSSNL